jgi:hypothetical protein
MIPASSANKMMVASTTRISSSESIVAGALLLDCCRDAGLSMMTTLGGAPP